MRALACVAFVLAALPASASFLDKEHREINVKIAWLDGDGTSASKCVDYVFSKTQPAARREMHSVGSGKQLVRFFDFVPEGLGEIRGFKVRFHLYATNAPPTDTRLREAVLKGADVVVLLAGPDAKAWPASTDLKTVLASMNAPDHPLVVVGAVRADGNVKGATHEEIAKRLGLETAPSFDVVPATGVGVFDSLKAAAKLALLALKSGVEQAPAPQASGPRVKGNGYSVPIPSGFEELHHSSVDGVWKGGGVVLKEQERPQLEDAFLASIVVTPAGATPPITTDAACADTAKQVAAVVKGTAKSAKLEGGVCSWGIVDGASPNRAAFGAVMPGEPTWVLTCNLDQRDAAAASACATVLGGFARDER